MSCTNTLSTAFSYMSTTSWVFAQMPQIYNNWRRKSTTGLSAGFLALWFLGDFLSFTSCLFNSATLPFQLLLSGYFLANDVCLAFQYWYYGAAPGRPYVAVARTPRPSDASSDASSTMGRAAVVASVMATARAVPLPPDGGAAPPPDTLGVVLAWCCTVVYVSSRVPQLVHNWRRRSVEGLSPVLFSAALLGNLFYTASILASCQFQGPTRWSFFVKELPYILGSSGTVVFDAGYFYQRWLYKKVDDVVVMEDL
ncbi:vacuolar arginine/histidine antiporter Ypq2p [Diutina catenulata]